MKFQVDRIDQAALEAHKKYSTPLAVADGPQAAAIAACAFARYFGKAYNVSVTLKTKDRGCDYMLMVGAAWGIDDIGISNRLDAFVKQYRAAQKRTGRMMAFYHRYQPDIHADYQGWKDANTRMEDGIFRKAVWDERYEDAVARALELGLVDQVSPPAPMHPAAVAA
jgi:hypothetical protein